MDAVTYIACPAYCPLGLRGEATACAQLRGDPLSDEELLDLAVGEDLCEITDQADAKLESSLRPLRICQCPLYELKDCRNMWQQKADWTPSSTSLSYT